MRASQLHKLTVRGENSAFQFAVSLKSVKQLGSDVQIATVDVQGFGNIGDSLDVTTDIGGGDVDSSYVVVAAAEDTDVMATGLAAAINAQTDHTAIAVESQVQILKSTAGAVQVISTEVS